MTKVYISTAHCSQKVENESRHKVVDSNKSSRLWFVPHRKQEAANKERCVNVLKEISYGQHLGTRGKFYLYDRIEVSNSGEAEGWII